MRSSSMLVLAVALLAGLLPGCGGDAFSATALSSIPEGDLVPVFDDCGFVVRHRGTDLPVYEVPEGAPAPDALRPLFDTRGGILRCPRTERPLYLLGNSSTPCLVRLGGS